MDWRFVALPAINYLESFGKQLGAQIGIKHLIQQRLCVKMMLATGHHDFVQL
jgi:hypothetical protein